MCNNVLSLRCCWVNLNLPCSHQAMRYMQLIPECQRPVSGTDGALQRRRKLLVQLPVYDQDPLRCQSLASEEEVQYPPQTPPPPSLHHTLMLGSMIKRCIQTEACLRFFNLVLDLSQISSMLLFVKRYKEEVLGVGEVALPGEGGALREAAAQRAAKEAKDGADGSSPSSAAAAANGTHDESTKTEYVSPESPSWCV